MAAFNAPSAASLHLFCQRIGRRVGECDLGDAVQHFVANLFHVSRLVSLFMFRRSAIRTPSEASCCWAGRDTSASASIPAVCWPSSGAGRTATRVVALEPFQPLEDQRGETCFDRQASEPRRFTDDQDA